VSTGRRCTRSETSGGNGLHNYVRIEPLSAFGEVREAALAFVRAVEQPIPAGATTTWWRKDRPPDKVFVDYNQSARDHIIASAYSVRGNREATVSTPIFWDVLDSVDPHEFTIATVLRRFAQIGNPHAGIDESSFSLQPQLEWAPNKREETLLTSPVASCAAGASPCHRGETAPRWRRPCHRRAPRQRAGHR
jgi:DNA primase